MSLLDSIRDHIRDATGSTVDGTPQHLSGGCINEAFQLDDYFVKTNRPDTLDMFEAEAEALQGIAATNTVRVPEVISSGNTTEGAFLVLEYLPLGPASSSSQETLGHQLAALHRTTNETFGWHRNNYIGSTPQSNTPTPSWPDFFRNERLAPLLQSLHDQGQPLQHADQLLDQLPNFFPNELPQPSLLHGDLWGGNAAALPDGTPAIFDPATYFGDREADLAMTKLFGGFNSSFDNAYQEAWPLDQNAPHRITLYNLYHILNHALLFGPSYHHQAQSMINTLMSSP